MKMKLRDTITLADLVEAQAEMRKASQEVRNYLNIHPIGQRSASELSRLTWERQEATLTYLTIQAIYLRQSKAWRHQAYSS